MFKSQSSEIYCDRDPFRPDTYVVSASLAGYLVTKPIAYNRAADAQTCTCCHVVPMVTVACNTVDGDTCGHGISRNTDPGRYVSILLVEYRGTGKGKRSVARRERMAVGPVRTTLADCMFQSPSHTR